MLLPKRKILPAVQSLPVALVVLILSSVAGTADGGGRQADLAVNDDKVVSLEISRETTYFTEPRDGRGGIDYEAAINHLMSEGVTSETNAVVALFLAIGPDLPYEPLDDRLFTLLGTTRPPEKGNYTRFLREGSPELSQEKADDLQEIARQTPWDRQQHPELATWIDENEIPLRQVANAVMRPHFFFPRIVPRPDPDSDDVGGLIACPLQVPQFCREIVRELTARAMMHTHDRQFDLAWSDLANAHRLSRLIGQGPSAIEGVASMSMEQMVLDAELAFLTSCDAGAFDLERCRQDLESLPGIPDFADKIATYERAMCLDLIQMYSRGEVKSARSDEATNIFARNRVNWSDVMRYMNPWFDRVAAAMRLDIFQKRFDAFEGLDDEIAAFLDSMDGDKLAKELAGRADRSELVGQVLVSHLVAGLDSCSMLADKTEQRMRLLQVAIQLKRFANDHGGAFPASLDELVPAYIKNLPNDLYVLAPLVYRPDGEGIVLYSVGRDQTDNGGLDRDRSGNGDDLVVRFTK